MYAILQVIDTRDRDWLAGNGKPIPGTGLVHNCDCCGKPHEVHVFLISDDDGDLRVGTSCVKKLRKTHQITSHPRRRDQIKRYGMLVTQSSFLKV